MKKTWTRFLLIGIAMVSLTLSACGGGGSSGGTTGGTTNPVYMTGQFIDSAVSGLIYRCSSGDSGITKTAAEGTLGEFNCQAGDTVEFFVGDYSIGSATAKKYITPYDLYPGNDAAAFNVAQLLLTLDSDNDPSNGITIPGVLPANLGTITARPGDSDFDAAMATALGEALIDATVAQNHLVSSYNDLLSTWDYHFDIGKPFYNIFFEDNEWKIVTVELTSESAVKATFEGTTYNGTWAVIDNEVYGEILNISVSGQDPGYYTLLVVEENRLNVCYADLLNEMDVCDDSEYFYFDLSDAQAHGGGGDTSTIVGSWINTTTENDFLAFNFYGNGTYAHMEVDLDDATETSGMEWGTYSVDETTGLVTVTQTFDNNDDTGLTDFLGIANLYIDVVGDVLTMSFDENGDGTIDGSLDFQRAISTGIVGSWINTTTENDFLAFNFYDNGTYVHMEVDLDDATETSGMEWGTYSVDETTGLVTVTQTFDNNDDTGLTDFLGIANLYIDVVGDVLTMSFDENGDGTIDGSLDFQRHSTATEIL